MPTPITDPITRPGSASSYQSSLGGNKHQLAVDRRWTNQRFTIPRQVRYQFIDQGGMKGLVDLGRNSQSWTWNQAHATIGASSNCATTSPQHVKPLFFESRRNVLRLNSRRASLHVKTLQKFNNPTWAGHQEACTGNTPVQSALMSNKPCMPSRLVSWPLT